jgi:hypothetical protein
VILPLLARFGITTANLGYFVLDNASNNDTTLVELGKHMGFDPILKRLRCMGHIVNLIAEAYIFGQDASSWEENFKKAGPGERRKLWRQRGELGKLHNLVTHVVASGKRTELFQSLQLENNTGVANGRVWKLVLDGGIRWNSTYAMIRRALELREALDAYAFKLRLSSDPYDKETFTDDLIKDEDWDVLKTIKDHLEPLFLLTKSLEGNATLKETAGKPSHGALWEILPVFQFLLTHWEEREKEAKAGDFNGHEGIQSSITLAWNATTKWYRKTDQSIAWTAAMVLHPRFKWQWFEENWTAPGEASILKSTRRKFNKLWADEYKSSADISRRSKTPEPPEQVDFLEDLLNKQAPAITRRLRPTSHVDELALYLQEPPEDRMGLLEYWQLRMTEWPHLAAMALDFHAIPAMSSECERVFSSCGMMTTPESSRLSGETL